MGQEQGKPIEAVLNELDDLAMQGQVALASDDDWACRRKAWRRKFRASCQIWYFQTGDGPVHDAPAQTRNISERGIGLLVQSQVPLRSPVEIRLNLPGRAPLHVAGEAAFSRATSGGWYELGVALRVHQETPIFHDNPMGACAAMPWIQAALRRLVQCEFSGPVNMSDEPQVAQPNL